MCEITKLPWQRLVRKNNPKTHECKISTPHGREASTELTYCIKRNQMVHTLNYQIIPLAFVKIRSQETIRI